MPRPQKKKRNAGGRPTKRTAEITAKIAEAISFGMTNKQASALVGINPDTLAEWMHIAEFRAAVESAVEARHLLRLKKNLSQAPVLEDASLHQENGGPPLYSKLCSSIGW
jgi:hypothetical protein